MSANTRRLFQTNAATAETIESGHAITQFYEVTERKQLVTACNFCGAQGSQILPGGFGHTAFYTNLLFPLTANRRGTGKVLSPAGKLHDEVAKSREVAIPDL